MLSLISFVISFCFVFSSATNEDEMCNFYLMYHTENEEPLDMKFCYTAGPPYYYWKNSEVHLNHIPSEEASQL